MDEVREGGGGFLGGADNLLNDSVGSCSSSEFKCFIVEQRFGKISLYMPCLLHNTKPDIHEQSGNIGFILAFAGWMHFGIC